MDLFPVAPMQHTKFHFFNVDSDEYIEYSLYTNRAITKKFTSNFRLPHGCSVCRIDDGTFLIVGGTDWNKFDVKDEDNQLIRQFDTKTKKLTDLYEKIIHKYHFAI